MIYSFGYEFDDQKSLEKAIEILWKKHKISGEMDVEPLENDRWRIDIHSEKAIKQSVLDSINGQQVKARSAVTKV